MSDIFRENPWNPVYFHRQLFADIFCETKKYAIYFMRHLVIYFLRHQHIRENPFLNSPISTEQQEWKHTAPLLFYRPIVESVWLCIWKECTQSPYSCYWGQKAQYKIQTREYCVSHSFSCLVLVLFIFSTHMRELKTRFKPCNNLQTSQVLCFTFLFGSGSVDVLCSY